MLKLMLSLLNKSSPAQIAFCKNLSWIWSRHIKVTCRDLFPWSSWKSCLPSIVLSSNIFSVIYICIQWSLHMHHRRFYFSHFIHGNPFKAGAATKCLRFHAQWLKGCFWKLNTFNFFLLLYSVCLWHTYSRLFPARLKRTLVNQSALRWRMQFPCHKHTNRSMCIRNGKSNFLIFKRFFFDRRR